MGRTHTKRIVYQTENAMVICNHHIFMCGRDNDPGKYDNGIWIF